MNTIKPDKCCGMGTYEHVIDMPINGRVRHIDYCVSDLVAALNASGITTVESCCGHGVMQGYITLEDDRMLYISNNKTPYREKDHKDPCGIKICVDCPYNISHYTHKVRCTNINLTQTEFEEVVNTQHRNDKCDLWNCFCINALVREELKNALNIILVGNTEDKKEYCNHLIKTYNTEENKVFIEAVYEYMKSEGIK